MIKSINHAKKFAIEKHRGQKRRDGKTPYWKHLQQVVNVLEKYGIKDEKIICAGWLHDTIEDTEVDYDDIKEQFGSKVANIVVAVTKDTRLADNQKETQYLKQLRKAPVEAQIVKIADITANLMDLKNARYDMRKQKLQVRRKLAYFDAIKRGISSNKRKIPDHVVIEELLNPILEGYAQRAIRI